MHKEYKRIIDHSEKAILFIHGIIGSPNQFNMFLPLVPEDISVYNILLDGHGKGVRDFSKTSMEKWKGQIACAVGELSQNHKEIYITAHSMGSLLAVEQAVSDPKIKKLFLLAVPLKLFVKPKMFINALKIHFGRFDPEDPVLRAAKESCSIASDRNLLHYLGWIPRYLELFSLIGDVRKLIGKVKAPTVAYQSGKDEMVSCKAAKCLAENPNISVASLKNSGHYYYEKADRAILEAAFLEFIQ